METVTNWEEYPGHLEAVEMVEIRPRLSGYIDSIHFEDGTEVKAGDLLFVIDPRPYQAELDRARAQRSQSETRLALARNDLKRAESLRGTKAISEEEYDSRNKAARDAEGGLGAARSAATTWRRPRNPQQMQSPWRRNATTVVLMTSLWCSTPSELGCPFMNNWLRVKPLPPQHWSPFTRLWAVAGNRIRSRAPPSRPAT